MVAGSGLVSGETVVEGFTLLPGGHFGEVGILLGAPTADFTVRDCVIDGFDARPFSWAAIAHYGSGSALWIHDSKIRNCRGLGGGAIALVNTDLVITDSVFESNQSTGGGGAIVVQGGTWDPAIHEVRLERCTFAGNLAGDSAGAVGHGSGSGYRYFEFLDCEFLDNQAENSGAIGLGVTDVATVRIEGCLFVGNRATNPGGTGGAVGLSFGDSEIVGCTFYGNEANRGACMVLNRSRGTMTRNIFAGSSGGPAVYLVQGPLQPTSECTVFWDNPEGNTLGYALGVTDREVDPLFCDAEKRDFTVHELSPCLPPNSLGCGQIGLYGQGCGVVSVAPSSWASISPVSIGGAPMSDRESGGARRKGGRGAPARLQAE